MVRKLTTAAFMVALPAALLAQPAAPLGVSVVEMHYADASLAAPPTEEFLKIFPSARQLPDNPLAVRMEAALARFDADWGNLPAVAVPEGKTLASGATEARVALVRERLGLTPGDFFDDALASRILAYRAAHDLPAVSQIDNRLVASLNRGHDYYRSLAELNLKRFKLLPSDLGARYVMVDLTTQTLRMVENGETVDTMKVVIGKPDTQTPVMAGVLRYTVLNPYWNVPYDLAQTNVARKYLSQGIPYLRRTGFKVLDDNGAVMDPAAVDWKSAANGATKITVRQDPGPGNGMGAAKFMFPNSLGIYLHDTPSRQLFDAEERMFSAGCIRVEDYRRFGTWLYGDMPTPAGNAAEQRVDIPNPVPVYVTYFTAVPTETGFDFREDIYGRDVSRIASLGT